MTGVSPAKPKADHLIHRQFEDNRLLPALFGEHDRNLTRLEQQLGVSLVSRGNRIAISGEQDAVEVASRALSRLYERLARGVTVDSAEVDAAVRLASLRTDDSSGPVESVIHTRRRDITARSAGQGAYIRALNSHELVFGLGPAGTGKTYLAVATAVAMMLRGEVERLILSRPAVEAGEKLGFLPGDLREKVDPYLRPLFDALFDMLSPEQAAKRLASGEIEVAPLAFMRGRTLSNSFIILDEAQNTTPVQMKMFLTRLGENSRMVVTGDLSQTDLPQHAPSGLVDAVRTLGGVEGVTFVQLTDADVVRHPLVTRIVRAYESREAGRDPVPETDLFEGR